jgi:hypothetical protein
MKNFTENEIIIINRFNTYKAWARETLISQDRNRYDNQLTWKYPELVEELLCDNSKRYASLVKIEAMISKPNFEVKLHAYGDRLQTKYHKLEEKLFSYADKASCHWKREGYDSRDEYRDELLVYSKLSYELQAVENVLNDLYEKVLNER